MLTKIKTRHSLYFLDQENRYWERYAGHEAPLQYLHGNRGSYQKLGDNGLEVGTRLLLLGVNNEAQAYVHATEIVSVEEVEDDGRFDEIYWDWCSEPEYNDGPADYDDDEYPGE